MGARGPLKLPSHLSAVPDGAEGSVSETAASLVPALAPLKPEDVENEPELNELWDVMVPELDKAGLVSVCDGPAVEMCLRHMIVARRAFRALGDEIVVPSGKEDVKKNPAEAVFRTESAMFLQYAQQLGMTFVARARTPAAKGDDGGENPFVG